MVWQRPGGLTDRGAFQPCLGYGCGGVTVCALTSVKQVSHLCVCGLGWVGGCARAVPVCVCVCVWVCTRAVTCVCSVCVRGCVHVH